VTGAVEKTGEAEKGGKQGGTAMVPSKLAEKIVGRGPAADVLACSGPYSNY